MIGLAFFFSLISGLGLILPSTPPPANPAAQTLFFGLSCAGSFLAGSVMLWWLLHAQILADTDGLRWRGAFGWKFVRWDQVADYYGKLPKNTPPDSVAVHRMIVSVVETSAGKLIISPLWRGTDALREQIAFHASSSREQHWGIKGTRLVDSWPHVFDYNTRENRWAPRIWLKLFLAYVVYLLLQPALKLTAMAGLIGWMMTLITAAFYLLVVGSLGLLFLIPLAQYRAAAKRRTERITADTYGLVFESETRRWKASWPEVTSYRIVSDQGLLVQYAVETQNGGFDFLPSMRDAALLREIIQCFAQASAEQEWCLCADKEVLGGEAARWSGGKIGVGARVYHYRNRMNRALLWMPLLFCGTFCLLAGLAWLGMLPGMSALTALSVGVANGFTAWLGYHAYRTCRVESGDEGLTQITLLGRQHLQWTQVEDYRVTKELGGVVAGRGTRIRFSPQIAGYDELKAQIASKAACGGTWESAPTTTSLNAR